MRGRARTLSRCFAVAFAASAASAASAVSGCASWCRNAASSGEGGDRPVPAHEPRAAVRLALNLASSADCEERFDLALYTHPEVVLIEWQPSGRKCEDRLATIHYLSRHTTAEQLVALAARNATHVSVQTGSFPR
jgi:hypothetical protein